ncbi:MAG TPA: hypothetical protein VIO13_03215 [Candidatus Dormibacteraeota bacterium]
MVTLYDQDAVVARDGLTLLAEYADAQRNTSDLAEWIDTIGKAHAAKIAADHPSQRGRLASARLTSIVAAIEEQLPPERRAVTANAQRS